MCWPRIALARALSPGFAPGQNFLRWRLLEPAARDLYVDWDEATDVAVSGLREAAASDPDDPRLRSLIDELSAVSERFRELWARADVGYRVGVIHMRHPTVGDLYLHRNRFNIPHSGGQHLLIYRAEPGSESARALESLRSLAGRLPGVGTVGRARSIADLGEGEPGVHGCDRACSFAHRGRHPLHRPKPDIACGEDT